MSKQGKNVILRRQKPYDFFLLWFADCSAPKGAHISKKTERQTTGEHGPGGNRQPGNYPGTCWSSVPSPGLAGHESAAAPECETDVGQGEDGGRALEGSRVLAFEGLFVAGIGGSYPLGNRRRGRRDAAGRSRGPAALRLRCLSGRSLVWNPAVTGETLCLLTSKAASAA